MNEWADSVQGPRPIVEPISWAVDRVLDLVCPECQKVIGFVDCDGGLRLVIWQADPPTQVFPFSERMHEKVGNVPPVGFVASGPLPPDKTAHIELWCLKHHGLEISVGEIRNAIAGSGKRIAARRP